MTRNLVLTTMLIVFLLCPKANANQIKTQIQTKKTTTQVKIQNNLKVSTKNPHDVATVKETIVKHSRELGIDPALALSIAKSESGFKHEKRSHNGAVGVFQLMPSTAKRLGVNPYYLSENIKGGLMYYKKMYNMFGSTELALAAYNAGPTAVKKYNKVPPYGETKHFVSSIMNEYNKQKSNPDPEIRKKAVVNKQKSNKLACKPEKPLVKKFQPSGINKEMLKEIKLQLPNQGVI